jgi:phosphate butyryltransferase
MLEAAAAAGPVPVAIAAAQELQILAATSKAEQLGIVRAILIGDAAEIQQLSVAHDLDLSGMHVTDQPDPVAAAEETMHMVARGEARAAIKGQLQTSEFLHAALQREAGLRTGRLVTHVGVFLVPDLDRLLFISDGGVVLYPTKEQKIEIVSNAIEVAQALGVDQPRVALLAAADQVLPQLPVTGQIADIVAMQDRWRSEAAWVDGPFLLDTAVSLPIALQQGRNGPVAGRAEVLVGPDVESVNIMAKGITYFAGGRMAGLVVGAQAPLVVGSRADPPETRLACIAAGALLAMRMDSRAA